MVNQGDGGIFETWNTEGGEMRHGSLFSGIGGFDWQQNGWGGRMCFIVNGMSSDRKY